MELTKEKVLGYLKSFFLSFVWLFIIMLIIDIVTKQVVIANKEYIRSQAGGQGIVLIPNFLAINYVVNHSLAFGISINDNPIASRAVYITCALIIVALILVYYILKYKKTGKYVKACLMLVLAGAIGNLIDRCFYSSALLGEENGVVDWINFYGVWKFNFNWADSCIVVGVIMLIVWLIVEEIIDYRRNKAKEVATPKGEKVLSMEEKKRIDALLNSKQEELSKKENQKNNKENG